MTNEEMAVNIKAGDTNFIPILWERVERLVIMKARDYFNFRPLTCAAAGVTLDDLQQEGYFAFLDAVKYFVPESGYLFITYMNYPLQNAFNACCGRRTEKAKKAVLNRAKSFSMPLDEDDFTLEDILEDPTAAEGFQQVEASEYNRQLRCTLEDCIETLNANQAATIRCRYFEGLSFREIAERTNVAESLCRARETEALRHLRRGKNLERLRVYREDIISSHAYRSGLGLWRSSGMSSTEYTVLKLERAEEIQRYKDALGDITVS